MKLSWPKPAILERTVTVLDDVTQETDIEVYRQGVGDYQVTVSEAGDVTVVWEDDDEHPHSISLGTTAHQEGYDVVGEANDTVYRLRPPRPTDAGTKFSQPVEVIEAALIRGEGMMADELEAVVAGDNTVATLMLETGLGTYVRYGADWQLLGPDSRSLENLSLVPVADSAVDTWDAADAAGTTISIFDLERTEPGTETTHSPEAPEESLGTEVTVPVTSSVPVVASVLDVDLAVRYAALHPDTRWYVVKRAIALGEQHRVPADWNIPVPTGQEPIVASADQVRRLAYAYVDGDWGGDPDGSELRALLASARKWGMLDDPAILAAINWRDWLHPRDRRGKFIETDGEVTVFGPGGEQRGIVKDIGPKGITVDIVDPDTEEVLGIKTVRSNQIENFERRATLDGVESEDVVPPFQEANQSQTSKL